MKNIMYDTIKTTVLIDTKFKKVKLSIFDITNVAVVPIKNNACSINSNCCFVIQSQKVIPLIQSAL